MLIFYVIILNYSKALREQHYEILYELNRASADKTTFIRFYVYKYFVKFSSNTASLFI
jgi:hypothetical protein